MGSSETFFTTAKTSMLMFSITILSTGSHTLQVLGILAEAWVSS
jgi:hypothetical protein